ncbi:sulfatase [Marinoscillum sp.]|uniref:sulfatase family protein n=1 Tax=Marinoscillum sp. TaxID=2024838 RepID=UPI003BA8C33D
MIRSAIPSLVGCLMTVIGLHVASAQDSKKMPNILLLYADQHNKEAMGFEGHPDVLTPNLDRLAEVSYVFDRAYCTTGICAPSRSSMMTGLYPRTLGILSNSERTQVMKEVTSMPSMLQNLGYKTYAFGKRHTSLAVDEGWHVHKSHLCDESPGDNYVTWVAQQGYGEEFAQDWAAEFGKGPSCSPQVQKNYPTADLGTRTSSLPPEYTMEAFTKQQTVQTIAAHAEGEEPFFIWASFYRPHQPYTPLQKFLDLYKYTSWGTGTRNGEAIKRPNSFYEPTENLPPFLQSQRNGGNKVWNMDVAFANEQLWRDYIASYYALVSEVDFHVGEIIEALEKHGLKEETIIIYTSDHGDFVGQHGMVEKAAMGHNVYEDILQVPLIIHYPGQDDRKIRYDLVSQVDILPTILEMIGADTPDLNYPLQGHSLHGVMTNGESLDRKYLVSESWSQATVITSKYKLGIMIEPPQALEQFDYRSYGDMFFDRKNDPEELSNALAEEAYDEEVKRLRTYYQQFCEKIPDTGKVQAINQWNK